MMRSETAQRIRYLAGDFLATNLAWLIFNIIRYIDIEVLHQSFSVQFSFFTYFSDFVIFKVVKWLFLIFHDFQFSCHIPSPTEDISKFFTFFSFPRHISRPKVCISHFP